MGPLDGKFALVAGHGGKDPGTISPFLLLQEKDVTLRLATLTGAALQHPRGAPATPSPGGCSPRGGWAGRW
jgi:hypothetical protein